MNYLWEDAMTALEVLQHYKSYHYFQKETGMSSSSLWNWVNRYGFVSIDSQLKIEKLSGGELKASLDDLVDYRVKQKGDKK
jgi:hypothetical protein